MTKVEENDTILDIEYDNYGNVIKIGNKEITYNNQNLVEKIKAGNTEYLYEYNYQGIRTKKKKKDEYEIKYYLDGRRIIGEELIDSTTLGSLSKKIYYYDESGISGINYKTNGTNNYYRLIKDTIGNVRKVVKEGKIVGEYEYDGWGNCEVIVDIDATDIDRSVVINNPFRYKGYYCDVETGLFYCNSRYYSPELCRWISPDSIEYIDSESINGLNLYCYCYDNPIMYVDPNGSFAISAIIIGAAIGFATAGIKDYMNDGKIFNGDISFWESSGQTVAISIGISILSYGVSSAISDAFGTLQYKNIRNISIKNINVNNHIKSFKGSYKQAGVTALKIGRNSLDDFLKAFSKTTSNVIVTEISGNIISISLSNLF